jgi:hypothetical protein
MKFFSRRQQSAPSTETLYGPEEQKNGFAWHKRLPQVERLLAERGKLQNRAEKDGFMLLQAMKTKKEGETDLKRQLADALERAKKFEVLLEESRLANTVLVEFLGQNGFTITVYSKNGVDYISISRDSDGFELQKIDKRSLN